MPSADPRLWTAAYRRLRRYVLERDNYECQVRGPTCTKVATVVDHSIDRADGGPVFALWNMRASCRACNGWRAAKRTNALRWRYRKGVTDYETRM